MKRMLALFIILPLTCLPAAFLQKNSFRVWIGSAVLSEIIPAYNKDCSHPHFTGITKRIVRFGLTDHAVGMSISQLIPHGSDPAFRTESTSERKIEIDQYNC